MYHHPEVSEELSGAFIYGTPEGWWEIVARYRAATGGEVPCGKRPADSGLGEVGQLFTCTAIQSYTSTLPFLSCFSDWIRKTLRLPLFW